MNSKGQTEFGMLVAFLAIFLVLAVVFLPMIQNMSSCFNSTDCRNKETTKITENANSSADSLNKFVNEGAKNINNLSNSKTK